jgi:hypothetical protein
MQTSDRAFLKDMVQFIPMNHISTVYALRQGLSTLDDIAMLTVGTLAGYDIQDLALQEASRKEVAKYNDTYRIQRILIAKIFAELISSYEDLGGLVWAIQHRNPEGIFKKYLNSKTSDVGNCYKSILESDIPTDPALTLDALMGIEVAKYALPSLQELAGSVQQPVLNSLTQLYQQGPKFLYNVAKEYRAKRDSLQRIFSKDSPPAGWENYINIIVDVLPSSTTRVPNIRSFPADTFNKVKHRFVVADNLSAYADPTEAVEFECATLDQEQANVEGMIQRIASVGKFMSQLAEGLYYIDKAGFSL